MLIEAIENPFAKVNTALNRATAGTTSALAPKEEGAAEEIITKVGGDTVQISQQAKNQSHISVSSKVLTQTEKEEEATTTPEDTTQERIKEIQKEMQELQQELQELMAADLGQEEKMQKMQTLQAKMARLQTELSELMDPQQ